MNASVPARFWARVQRGSECWIWTGATDGRGYGQFFVGPKPCSPMKAHRVAWLLARGPIPPNMCVLHTCDVRACVNPDHLFLGNIATNNRDMAKKGRAHRPFGNLRHAKLSPTDVEDIQRLYTTGQFTQARLGKRYGITRSAIGKITTGVTWHRYPVRKGAPAKS